MKLNATVVVPSKIITVTYYALQVISAVIALAAVVVLGYAVSFFYGAILLVIGADTHLHVSESQPHGLDGLGAIFSFVFGIFILAIAIGIGFLAILLFKLAKKKLTKKTAVAAATSEQDSVSPQACGMQVPTQTEFIDKAATEVHKEAIHNRPT